MLDFLCCLVDIKPQQPRYTGQKGGDISEQIQDYFIETLWLFSQLRKKDVKQAG